MPKSKSSDLRIKVIDRCLSDRKRKYSTAMIFDACNEELLKRDFVPITAMNSVRDDIEQIQRVYPGADVESVREGRNIYYRYADPYYSITEMPLTIDDCKLIKKAITLIDNNNNGGNKETARVLKKVQNRLLSILNFV